MVGILIGTFAVVAIALAFAALGLTEAALLLGVAAAVAIFAIATVTLRQWATCEHGAAGPDEAGQRAVTAALHDHPRRVA